MRKHQIDFIENEVKNTVMPDIRSDIPGILGWVLRTIFPKMQQKIIDHIMRIAGVLLEWQRNQNNSDKPK